MLRKISLYIAALLLFNFNAAAEFNGTMIQYFEWYTTKDENLWVQLNSETDNLAKLGITAIWLPPAYKGAYGDKDAGYAVYDKYDLGEFNQRGSVRTKYGTRAELITAVTNLHKKNIQVYGDIVLNHLMGDIDKYNLQGADESEVITVIPVDPSNRNHIDYANMKTIKAWTKLTFPGRNNKYSNFIYDSNVISGINWELTDPKERKDSVYLLNQHAWSQKVDDENGNYDYLLGLNLDYSIPAMRLEAATWGKWYTNTLNLDGYRLDAVKHIDADFMRGWLETMRSSKPSLFAVGEYWHGDLNKLEKYEAQLGWSMSLFDVPLHYHFYEASKNPNSYDLRRTFDNTVVGSHPLHAVTFVDNHDTEPGQSLESFIEEWFKPLAYTLILTRQSGYPCLFYGDYYGIKGKKNPALQKQLEAILLARKNNAYGHQRDYFIEPQTIAWVREGTTLNQGLAALVNTANTPKLINMSVGVMHKNQHWIDITNNYSGIVVIDNMGLGNFYVNAKSTSIWVPVNY